METGQTQWNKSRQVRIKCIRLSLRWMRGDYIVIKVWDNWGKAGMSRALEVGLKETRVGIQGHKVDITMGSMDLQ